MHRMLWWKDFQGINLNSIDLEERSPYRDNNNEQSSPDLRRRLSYFNIDSTYKREIVLGS